MKAPHMRWWSWAIVWIFVLVLGCEHEADTPVASAKMPALQHLPFKQIPSSGDNPAENGPDDETEMDAIEGEAGKVVFPHFTHASNAKSGRRIPCIRCHHKTETGKDPEAGCAEKDCHSIPGKDADLANGGPDDNFILERIAATELPVPFNHYTHASSTGYKTACDKCHHTGENTSCGDCHKLIATLDPDGVTVPKMKRAFHLTCKGCHQALKKSQPDTIAPTHCKDCHVKRELLEVDKDVTLTLNRAYHIQCIECHDQVNKASREAKAPTTTCTGCHEAKKDDSALLLDEMPGEAKPAVEEIPRDPELEKKVGAETIVIDFFKKTKSATVFEHKVHQDTGEECYTCHHKGLKDPTCRTCHDTLDNAKKAYHTQCRNCHKENDIANKCITCHPE